MTDDRKNAETIVRAITFPIAEPISGGWKELRDALQTMWIQTTQASNWTMRELYARDVRRDGQAKMPKYEHRYLYPEIRTLFPDLPPQTVASMERAIAAKYRALRYKIIWTCEISLPSFHYPAPFPIHNQSWNCWFDKGNRPIVNPRISDCRWELRLRGGPRYRRQLAAFRQIVDAQAKPGEMAIYKNGDGEILCKLVARFPLVERGGLQGRLTLKTSTDNLLIAYDAAGEQVRFWNWPHVIRWVREHQTRIAMFSEDQKAEQRRRREGASFQARREAVSQKFNHRIDSAVKELAAQAVGLATRFRVAEVRYDDQERHSKLRELKNDGATYRELFPWYALKQRIGTLCQERRIAFTYLEGE